MIGILSWIVLGIAAGAVAKWVMPGPPAASIAVAMVIGVAGALAGGLMGAFGIGDQSSTFDVISLLTAAAGTLASLFVDRAWAMSKAEIEA